MQLTAGEIWDATEVLAGIIRRPRQLPQLAKYKIAKMHNLLSPIYDKIEEERIALVEKYGHETFHDEAKTKSKGWEVEEGSEAMKLYRPAWDAVRSRVLQVAITPLTMQLLGDSEHGIEAGEFKFLGPLVVDTSEETPQPAVGNA